MKPLRRILVVYCAAALACITGAQGALAQTLGQGPDADISVWRIIASLALCTVLAVAGAFFLRARGGLPSMPVISLGRSRRLKLVESLRLGQDSAISIVSCDGRELLVLVSREGGRVIEELPASAAAAVEPVRGRG